MNMILKMSAGVLAAAFSVSVMACPPSADGTHQVSAKSKTCNLSKVAKKSGSCDANKLTKVSAKAAGSCSLSQVASKAAGPCKLSQVAKKSGPCNASKKTSLVKAEGKQCPVDVAMKRLPQITYVVGKTHTQCQATAGKLAVKSGTDATYMVAGKKFSDMKLAKVAHVEATENFVNAMCDSHKCPKSGKTFVGKKSFHCAVSAGKIASAGKSAMEKVVMQYKVGKKAICCPDMASDFAKSTKQAVTFKVGTSETTCSMTGRMNLAKAKYRAAVVAMMKTESEAKAKSEKMSKLNKAEKAG